MLYIYFGSINQDSSPDIYVKHIDSWFNNYFEESWTDNEWAKRVVKEIDKSELLSLKVIDSKWLGATSVECLSGGAKQLIMANAVPNIVFNGNNFGDNCFPLLLELSKTKDIMMDLYYHPIFEWPEWAEVTSINTGNVVRSYKGFAHEHMSSEVYGFTDFEKVNWPLALNMDAFKDEWFDSI
jgi:hypothetical protein